ncbi:MAG: DUF2334 domain-containing protein [Terracidiphilus sp.]
MRRSVARYLLRFDDLCPTMSRAGWERFEELLTEFGVRPILAVVPDNQDSGLKLDDPDPEFWQRMRAMKACGATIALHGYQHLCSSPGRSILSLHRYSEFAGVGEATQLAWIQQGISILQGHGLHPELFAAPRHGFDAATLRALRTAGMDTLSDGFGTRPFLCEGMTWIPQQLWRPIAKDSGIWTICLHSNTASDADVQALRDFLQEHASQFISVREAVKMRAGSLAGRVEAVRSKCQVLWLRAKRSAKSQLRNDLGL